MAGDTLALILTGMKRLLLAAALLLTASPAFAATLALVNQTGERIVATSIRPTDSQPTWQPLAGGQDNGARHTITVSTDAQCAFDIRARLASGKELTYGGVNLCETSAVTLNRRGDGTTWVDYD